jgi:AraC family transcriptional regulator
MRRETHMTGRQADRHYFQRIDAVIAYVRTHLDDDLPLTRLAAVAGFSPFHFHRLFKTLTGETIADLVLRLRLERAVALLRAAPTLSITEAAIAGGFSSVAVFSRAFRRHYGHTARIWDRKQPLKASKNHQNLAETAEYTGTNSRVASPPFKVQLRHLPAQRLAYVRVYDAYRNPLQVLRAYERLLSWYVGQGGRLADTQLYGMSQDDPDITPLRLCRFDWCLTMPAAWRESGGIGLMTLPACEIAAIRCVGGLELEDQAFGYLFRDWLPRSGYQPANLPALEIYQRQPAELGWETFDMDCAVPIEPIG